MLKECTYWHEKMFMKRKRGSSLQNRLFVGSREHVAKGSGSKYLSSKPASAVKQS